MPERVKVLFLDRDGTIIYDRLGDYITRVDQALMIPGSDDAIAKAKKAGFKIVIASNQAGIAKGIVSKRVVEEINAYMQSVLEQKQAGYDLCYFAPYHPDYPNKEHEPYKTWRKPNIGMVVQAIQDMTEMGLDVDIEESYFIGDKQVDVACGIKAGLRPILVRTGYAEVDECTKLNTVPEYVADDLYDAIVNYILPGSLTGKAGRP
ncbi:MAG: HAD-IIIA family hydrolase [Chlorobiales bacterium]|nr:HAD-IIIA family hydrolase [Chlorobiales bacterium]